MFNKQLDRGQGMSGIGFFSLVPLLLTLAFYVLIVYLIINVVRFMKQKSVHDRERNDKLDALIHLLKERERQE